MQDHKDVPLGIRIDSMVAHFLRQILYWLGLSLLVLAGVAVFALLPLSVFEYREGLYDISLHEWLFLALTALLLWRYSIHCSRFDIPWATRISRVLVFCGGLAVIHIVVILTSALMLVSTGKDLHSALNNPELNYLLEIIFWFGLTFTLYLASPPSPRVLKGTDASVEDIPVVQAEDVPSQNHNKEQI